MNILILVMIVAAVIVAIYSAVKGGNILWVSVILLCIIVAMQSAGVANLRLG